MLLARHFLRGGPGWNEGQRQVPGGTVEVRGCVEGRKRREVRPWRREGRLAVWEVDVNFPQEYDEFA